MHFSDQSDESLLKDAATGRFAAFEELIQRHQQRLLNFYWRMTGSQAEAETLFEETWNELYKLRNSSTAALNVDIALFGIATRKAIRVAMENPPPRDEKADSSSWNKPSSLAARSIQLNSAILSLPLKERASVLLIFFDSLHATAMAACINEREETARALADAGLQKLLLALGAGYSGDDTLKALALETNLSVDKSLIRRCVQSTRRLDVSERLALQAGEDVARAILLNRQPTKKNRAWTPSLYAALALLAALGFFYLGNPKPGIETPKAPESSPAPVTLRDISAMTTPSLSEKEKAQENELDSKARRMLISQLKHEKRSVPTIAPTVTPTAVRITPVREEVDKVEPPSFSLSQSKLSLSRHDKINFTMCLPEKGQVELRIFDTSGRTARLLADGQYGPGDLNLSFEGKNDLGSKLPPGIYYARVMTRWFSRVEALELQP